MYITQSGMVVRSPIEGMRPMGRGTQGVRLVNLKQDDRLVAAEIVRAEDKALFEGGDEGQTPTEVGEHAEEASPPESPEPTGDSQAE